MKRKLFIICFILSLFLVVGFSASANNNTTATNISNKFRTNATHTGGYFKIDIMGNYYKIEVFNQPTQITEHAQLMSASPRKSKAQIETNNGTLNQNTTITTDNLCGLGSSLPKGYIYTILDFLALGNYADQTTIRDNATYYIGGFYYDQSYITNTGTGHQIYATNYNYAQLYYFCDMVTTTIKLSQYQKWWFGDQVLWTQNVNVVVCCNIVLETILE